MLKISDKKFFLEIVADAVTQAHQTCRTKKMRNRWINAVAKAAAVILEGDCDFLHWDSEKNSLLFWSADSNEIYDAGEACQCPAFQKAVPPLPCYHRAISRLVKNYFEFQRKPDEIPKIDFADAVFFDPELSAREKVELLNLSILEGRTELKPKIAALQKYV
jgi:hypothetical protein